jgi:hypothetical protein
MWKLVQSYRNDESLEELADTLWWTFSIAKNTRDLKKLESTIWNLEQSAIKVAWWEYKKDFTRLLSVLSLIFFLFYIIMPKRFTQWKNS